MKRLVLALLLFAPMTIAQEYGKHLADGVAIYDDSSAVEPTICMDMTAGTTTDCDLHIRLGETANLLDYYIGPYATSVQWTHTDYTWMSLKNEGTSAVQPLFENSFEVVGPFIGDDGTFDNTIKFNESGATLYAWTMDGTDPYFRMNEGASPGAADATNISCYANTSGQLCCVDDAGSETCTVKQQTLALSMYDAEPARGSETNIHGGLLSLATAQALNSGASITVDKGIGKLIVIVNAGSDVSGSITVTGTSVNRETGATSAADTDTITVDATTTDNSDTDSNGNTRHAFTGAYITSKWFTSTATPSSVVLSTADLTLTDVDVYHVSFEQFNDASSITLDTLDANIYTTNVNAEFDAYLYSLQVTGDKCDVAREASINLGADGETAIASRYWRLRRGNIATVLDGTTDGIWIDIHYSNSPAYVEDVSLKVWASITP